MKLNSVLLILFFGANSAWCAGFVSFSTLVSFSTVTLPQSGFSPPVTDSIDRCVRNGQFSRADSLFADLDNRTRVDSELLIRWAGVKITLGGYSEAARLYCRVLAANPRQMEAVFSYLYQAFEGVPAETIASAFGAFRQCAFDIHGIDTVRLQLSLADFYARHGMEVAELHMLASVSSPSPELVTRLLGMARERFQRGAMSKTIPPAGMAYSRSADAGEKALAAELLYRAYLALRRNDSALVWLAKAGITDNNRRIDAAALCQSTGRFAEAKKNMETIAPSFSRDTIELRHYIFGGDTKGAVDAAKKKAKAWEQRPGDVLLWRIRTLLFDGALSDMQSLFDSGSVESSWKTAKELLEYRYRLEFFNRSEQALSLWSRIEYDIYTGNARRAAGRLVRQPLPPEFAEALHLRVVRELLALGDAASASELFSRSDEIGDSPEYLYMRALVELANGRETEARNHFLRVISDFPEDIYSEKARIALQELRQKG